MEMDRPSIAFARFLDSVMFEEGGADRLQMTCTQCSAVICDAEPGDTMRVLLNTALAHVCGA